jgi:hypothetical protein
MMIKENYKIENHQDSIFQNFLSLIVFFLNVFNFSKNLFQNLVRRGVRGGWCRNIKAQRKNSKLEFKLFFKVLKLLSFFLSISGIFLNFFIQNIMGRDVGSGGRVIPEPECPNKSLRLKFAKRSKSC